MLTLRGKVNNNDKTKFMVGFSLDNNANSIPKEFGIYEMQPIRIYRDGDGIIMTNSNLKPLIIFMRI